MWTHDSHCCSFDCCCCYCCCYDQHRLPADNFVQPHLNSDFCCGDCDCRRLRPFAGAPDHSPSDSRQPDWGFCSRAHAMWTMWDCDGQRIAVDDLKPIDAAAVREWPMTVWPPMTVAANSTSVCHFAREIISLFDRCANAVAAVSDLELMGKSKKTNFRLMPLR